MKISTIFADRTFKLILKRLFPMRKFVFSTPIFEDEISKHGAKNVFIRFRDKVENHNFEHQLRNELTTIKDGHRYVRDRHQNFRAVYEYQERNICGKEVGIYVGLRDFNHDNDYAKFYKPQTDETTRNSLSGVNDVDWENIEKDITARLSSSNNVSKLKPLSEAERLFINDSESINHSIMPEWVYESDVWKRQMMTPKYQKIHYKIGEILRDFFVDAVCDESPNKIYDIELRKEDYIIVRKEDTNFFLLELGDKNIKSKWTNKSLEELRQNSRRGYPCSILWEIDEWHTMELDEYSNFILSDEERDIVMSQSEYPLFISGRAGSGKSTVLQYMFAELLLRYIKIKKNFAGLLPPVYLSYSKTLVSNARRLARSLFEHSNVYKSVLGKERLTFEKDVEPLLESCFCVFGDIVRDCIVKRNAEVVKKRFNPSKHVSFAEFTTAWEKHFGRNHGSVSKVIGPSISWHIINTYIKGWDSSDVLTPEDYENLGRDDKNVSSDVYKEVYEKVYKQWYEEFCCEKEGRWDDQDLVRYSLSPDDNSIETYVTERYSGIFCDEAQDFTRTQIDFILQLSSFFNRSLDGDSNDIFKLPFVFAGDEFQTLNPTGFRWDVLRSYFMDTLRRSCGVGQVSAPEPRQLSENYRSSAPIVKLGNRFQLLRECRFGMASNPQKEHFQDNDAPVYCLPADDENVWVQLKKKNAILIVPAPEGITKQDYIKTTPINGKISFDANGISKDMTILTPAQAKGLEYPCVAIYGFDEDKLHKKVSLSELINWFENKGQNKKEEPDEENMALKYLVSNAYVAITRAKRNLYILDSFSTDSFWSFAFSFTDDKKKKDEERLQGLMFQSLKENRKSYWKPNDLGYIGEGTAERDINAEMSVKDIENSLNDMEATAVNSADVELLMQVASRYRERGKMQDAARCTAEAYQIQERYYEAGKEYKNAKDDDKAVQCYWKVVDKDGSLKAISLCSSCKSDNNKVIVEACKTIIKGQCELQDISKIFYYIVSKPEEATMDTKDDERWLFIIRKMLDIIPDTLRGSKEVAKKFISNYDNLCKANGMFKLADDLLVKVGNIAYNVGINDKAMAYWGKSQSKPVTYYKERLKTANYPETIAILPYTKDPEWKKRIITEYRKHPNVTINNGQFDILVNAIMEKGTADDFKSIFAEMLLRTSSKTQAYDVLEKASKKRVSYNDKVLRGLIAAKYTDMRDWEAPSLRKIYDDGIRQAIKMLRDLKRIRTQKFDNELPTGSDRVIRDFMSNNFSGYKKSLWLLPIIVEIGRKYESRHRFVDTLSFYEWALGQGFVGANRDKIRLRWIYNKEQKGDDARDRRKQWGFPETGDLPIVEDLIPWDSIFKEALSLPEQDYKNDQVSACSQNRSNKNPTATSEQKASEKDILSEEKIDNSDKQLSEILKINENSYAEQYNELKDKYNELLTDYNKLKEDYKQLKDRYIKLMEDYIALMKK